MCARSEFPTTGIPTCGDMRIYNIVFNIRRVFGWEQEGGTGKQVATDRLVSSLTHGTVMVCIPMQISRIPWFSFLLYIKKELWYFDFCQEG